MRVQTRQCHFGVGWGRKTNLYLEKTSCLLENGTPLGYYAASSGNFLPRFRDNLSVPFSRVRNFLTPEDETDG
jgi:hypothetical protein